MDELGVALQTIVLTDLRSRGQQSFRTFPTTASTNGSKASSKFQIPMSLSFLKHAWLDRIRGTAIIEFLKPEAGVPHSALILNPDRRY